MIKIPANVIRCGDGIMNCLVETDFPFFILPIPLCCCVLSLLHFIIPPKETTTELPGVRRRKNCHLVLIPDNRDDLSGG